MSDSLRDDAFKATRNAECKPKIVAIKKGRPSKSWLEIYTENIEKETARKIFADIDNLSSPYIGRTLMLNRYIKDTDVEKLKKKYGVEDCSKK